MGRIKFKKGLQRKFFEKILEETGSPSLMELSRRLEINYSTLKNYFIEERLISEELLGVLLKFADLDKSSFDFEILQDNWGRVKGGRIGKRKK